MRDTKTLFDTFEDIKTLCQYLYMSEDHEILIHNSIGVPLKIYMREDLEIMSQNMNFPELPPMHLGDATPSKLCDIITCLKEEPALEIPDSFRNRWEEVKALTGMQLGLNEPNYTRIKEREKEYSHIESAIKQGYDADYFKIEKGPKGIYVIANEQYQILLPDGDYYRSADNYLRAHTEHEIVEILTTELRHCVNQDVGEERTNDALLCLMGLKERFEYSEGSEKALNYLIENGLNRMESYKNKESIEEERDDI